jgi:hypothetical protein
MHDVHIVLGDHGQTVKALYVGRDATEAEKVYQAAGKDSDCVRLLSYPQPIKSRYPAEEAIQIAERAKLANVADVKHLTEKRLALNQAEAAAKKAQAEAEQLRAEIKQLETPGGGPQTGPQPAGGRPDDDDDEDKERHGGKKAKPGGHSR